MPDANAVLPFGNVTILFTDIEDSSRIKRQSGIGDARYKEEMLMPHFERLHRCLVEHHGHQHGPPAGDSIMAVFQNPDDALACAKAIQEDLAADPIKCKDAEGNSLAKPDGTPWRIAVRIGLHRSEKHLEPGYYSGTDADFASRIMSLGKGEQVLVSAPTRTATAWERFTWYAWENRFIKSFEDAAETVYEMLWKPGQTPEEPGLRWLPRTFRVERNRYISRPTPEASIREQFNRLRNNGKRARLVTLHGFGGMGKTRMAVAVALQVASIFKDGIYFISLAERLPSAQSVVEAIGAVLEMEGNPATLDDLLPALLNRESLLVLDNYESVHCNEVQRFFCDLLNGTNHLRLLVTGREAIRIADSEQRIPTDCMTMQESTDLFIARAQLLRPDWQPVTSDEHIALHEILVLTACIPLALELVATHIYNETLREIVDSLEAIPLPALPPDYVPGDPNERHQSIERCLDWSWKYLSAGAQDALARVSLFADTFSTNTVQSACALENARPLLNKLHESALLVRSELAGHTRYALLRPTRAYTRQKFDKLPNAAELLKCYIAFYTQLVLDDHDINDHAKNAILEREWHNALVAADLARAQSDWKSISYLSERLGVFLLLRGLWSECEQLNKDTLNTAQIAGQREAEDHALNNLGIVYRNQGRWDEAETLDKQSLEISREFQDRVGEGNTLWNIAVLKQAQGDYDAQLDYMRQALQVFEKTQDERSTRFVREWIAGTEARLKEQGG